MAQKQKQVVHSGTEWEDQASYRRAVRVGDHIWVSGTTSVNEKGEIVGRGDVEAQTRFIYNKIEKAINAVGGKFSDIVRTRVFLADIKQADSATKVHGERFSGINPANTTVEAKLVSEELLVEIEAEAIVGVS